MLSGFSMLIIALFFAHFDIVFSQSGLNQYYKISCPENCAYCPVNSYSCLACKQSYERSELGQCVREDAFNYCQDFTRGNNCQRCKPTYRLFSICVAMYDGCLISGPEGTCSKCIKGAFLNQFGRCNLRYINCIQTDINGICSKCQNNYKLLNGKCLNSQKQCRQKDQESGLCLNCDQPFVLHNYQCIKRQQILANCYLMDEYLEKCSYCKSQYYHYNGACLIEIELVQQVYENLKQEFQCSDGTFLNKTSWTCEQIPKYCEKFDYGLMKCVFCTDTKIMVDGVCRDSSLRFCKKFVDNNSYDCQQCLPKFFLNSQDKCTPYPPFCETVIQKRCVKCISRFLLNQKGFCEDPNCNKFDSITYECNNCKYSYFLNESSGICTFRDIHCAQFRKDNPNECLKCKIDYMYDTEKKQCKFVDPDCKIWSGSVCIDCNEGYYLDKRINYCLELPDKCEVVDYEGKCKGCTKGYALLTTHECIRIQQSNNCQQLSKSNLSVCESCKNNSYLDLKTGTCKQFPPLCLSYDQALNKCQKCQSNGQLRDGSCYDRYCEIFGAEGSCYGCKKGYVFDSNGYCIKEDQSKDKNCKQFVYGQCRKCSDRYYFDENWNCIQVSNLCENYDRNNGYCTSCHSGYQIWKGQCILSSLAKQKCLKYENNSCIQCNQEFYLYNGVCYDYIIGCLEKSSKTKMCVKCSEKFTLNKGLCEGSGEIPNRNQYTDNNCLQYNQQRTKCVRCIARTYFSQILSRCQQIDKNCEQFVDNGDCLKCYSGYSVSKQDKKVCVIKSFNDPNCKQQGEDGCDECYSGFYYSPQEQICLQSDRLCKTVNNRGECLSCWEGYDLEGTKCILTPLIHNQQNNPSQVPSKEEVQCIAGQIYDTFDGKCKYPQYGNDINCQQYYQSKCRRCKDEYIMDHIKCISKDPRCLQYNPQQTQCVKCEGNLQPQKLNCI